MINSFYKKLRDIKICAVYNLVYRGLTETPKMNGIQKQAVRYAL